MKGAPWVCLGTANSSLQVLRPGHALSRSPPGAPSLNLSGLLHQEPLLPCPPQCISSVPCPARGGPGAGLMFPGGVEVLLSDAESLGGEGCALPLFAPRDPREVRLGLISLSAHPPTPLHWGDVPKMR